MSGVLPQDAQKLMRQSDINLTMRIYTHLKLSDKASSIQKLPTIEIKERQVKTGTFDVLGNSTSNLTGNPVKIQRNSVQSEKVESEVVTGSANVTPLAIRGSGDKRNMGALGLEPRTYALKGRCSTS